MFSQAISAGGRAGSRWLRRLAGRGYSQRRKAATCAAAVLAVGVGYHVMFGQNGLTAYGEKKQNLLSLQQQMNVLALENEELKAHVERLASDADAIEHQAREELHYTRSGEVIVTLPAETASVSRTGKGR